jgi:hypothetical protein
MRNNYHYLFWVWIFVALFVSVFTFIIGIDKAFPGQTIRFFNITSYLFLSLFYFVGGSSLLSSTVDELATKARKQLPWNEYFDLKRETKIPLDHNDERYAAQKVETDNLPDFLKQFAQQDKKQLMPLIFFLCYMVVLVILDLSYKKHSNLIPILSLLSYINIPCMFYACYYYIKWVLPQQKNQFIFAKKIDHLVFENKLRIWR